MMNPNHEKPPVISVVMSAYNAELYVAEAIQSILDQTFGDFELIVLNDGSTDKTAEIIRSFTDRRILFLDEAKNRGLANRLNQGFAVAKGAFIARMDADDWSFPQRFEKQVAYMETNPDICVLGTYEVRADRNLKPIEDGEQLRDIVSLPMYNVMAHTSIMIRRSLLPEWARYNEEYAYAEDYALWFDVLPYVKIENMKESLVMYRQHKQTSGRMNFSVQERNTIRARVKFIRQHLQVPIPRKHRAAWEWLTENGTTISMVQFAGLFSFLEGKILAVGPVGYDKIELTPGILGSVFHWNLKHRRDSLKYGRFDRLNVVYKRQVLQHKATYKVRLRRLTL